MYNHSEKHTEANWEGEGGHCPTQAYQDPTETYPSHLMWCRDEYPGEGEE